MTRRDLLKVVAAGLGGAALGAGTFGRLAASVAVVAAKPKQVNVAVVEGVEIRGLRAVAPMWDKTTGVHLNLISYPYPSLYEKMTTAFQANSATFDVVMMDDPWMPKFGSEGWLAPLDAAPFNLTRDPDIFPVVYDLGSWPPPTGPVPPGEASKPRHIYAITVVGNVELFMYRKDLVQAPQTWDQVLAAGTKFSNPGKQFYGYAIRGAKGNPIIADWFPMLRAFGGNIFDDHWNVVFKSAETTNALKFLVGQLKAVGQPGADTTDAADRTRLVATGHALQGTVWPAEASDILENPQVSTVIGKVGYTVIPMGAAGKHTPMMGNWLLGIPKSAAQKDWAYRFITWVTNAQVQQTYAAAGGIPFRKSILTDAALNKRYPFFQAMAGSLAAPPFWRPRTSEWSAVESILGTHVNAALAGTEAPDQAVDKAQAEVTQHMKEAGYIK
ncbi:MAG TPA: extracellular solute-binding protein [bacterium]|nr:extracellular solute-binding protein [bacterium]